MRIGSLCSGYGGLDLAVEWRFSASVEWHAENAAAPARVLAARWPGVPNHGDITRIDWRTVEPIDILTAGYPCQPFALAGKRKGTTDERHLWPAVREAIRHLRPRITVLENVAGHRSLGFDEVLGDLAALGLDAEWTSLRASDVGAPHGRERIFVLAYLPDSPVHGWSFRLGQSARPTDGSSTPNGDRTASDYGGEEFARWARLRADETTGLGWARPRDEADSDRGFPWVEYSPAIERWARIVGRRPPRPVVKGKHAGRALSHRFVEWFMGLPDGWVTDVQGVNRKQAIEMCGNGVVPQQAIGALELLTACEVAA
jgi:DNA (cytosine-5)-methyltransferase 1